MDPAFITAWATVAIAASTVVVGGATCFLIWRGLKAMDRSSDERARDRRAAAEELKTWRDDTKAWRDEMTAWRDDMKAWREADIRRHEEAREADVRRHDEAMAALRELIVRTSPAAPAK